MNEDKDALIYLADVRIDELELEAENAKLREELEAAKHDLQVFSANLARLDAENAKLRETLKVLMMGTNAELCSDRDEADCRMCSMHHGEDGCTVVDAMKLLGIDMYGMPLGVEVDE